MFFNLQTRLKNFKKQLNDADDVSIKIVQTKTGQKVGMIFCAV